MEKVIFYVSGMATEKSSSHMLWLIQLNMCPSPLNSVLIEIIGVKNISREMAEDDQAVLSKDGQVSKLFLRFVEGPPVTWK